MKFDDNSVNMDSGRDRYHHGDLRQALIAEAMAMLDSSTADGLSLRQVARNVGVSATAVYRHFPDKDALLRALAREGGARLAHEQRAAMALAHSAQEGFEATGAIYVRFAIRNSALFRLMMAGIKPERDAGLNEDDSGLKLLFENAARLLPNGASPDVVRVKAIQAWASVHGLAMLMLDGQINADDTLIDQIVRWENVPASQ